MYPTLYQQQYTNLIPTVLPESKREMPQPEPINVVEPYAFGYLAPETKDYIDDIEEPSDVEETFDYGDEITEEGNVVFEESTDEDVELEAAKLNVTEDKTNIYLFLKDYSAKELASLTFADLLTPVEQWTIIKKSLFTSFTKVDGLAKVADKYIKVVADAILINRDQIEDHPTAYHFLMYAKDRGLI